MGENSFVVATIALIDFEEKRSRLRRRSNFYGPCWALCLACKALDAVGFTCRVRTFISAGCLTPVVERNWADADAYTVSNADVPVDG